MWQDPWQGEEPDEAVVVKGRTLDNALCVKADVDPIPYTEVWFL